MHLNNRLLRKIIKEELALRFLLEQDDQARLTNAEFTKALKTDAADLVANIPVKFNDEMAIILQVLIAMAQHDVPAFQKMLNYAETLGTKALDKASSEGTGVKIGEGISPERMSQIIKEEIAQYIVGTSTKK
tara:strand:+ start:11381 stop:11776 length:396 start_codon:yes stop_codon:yes gene_type:complete